MERGDAMVILVRATEDIDENGSAIKVDFKEGQ